MWIKYLSIHWFVAANANGFLTYVERLTYGHFSKFSLTLMSLNSQIPITINQHVVRGLYFPQPFYSLVFCHWKIDENIASCKNPDVALAYYLVVVLRVEGLPCFFFLNCNTIKYIGVDIPSLWLWLVEDLFPDEEPNVNAKKRLCAYRNLVFWCWPNIRRKERRPLPSCLVSLVRATFPPTDNEEEFANWQFAGFCYAEDA